MTEKIRKEVDGLTTSNIMGAEMLRKSDVLELVESLTKWIKVEDGLPEKYKNILIRNEDDIDIGQRIHDGGENLWASNCGDIEGIIEWKTIDM